MRILALMAAASLVAVTPAHAEVGKPHPEFAQLCPTIEKLARQVMKNRQGGVPLSKMLGTLEGSSEPIHSLVRSMIMDAYEETQWHTDSSREDTANRYAEKWSLDCYQIAEGKK